ncbi:GntR family transcriptional regulator [Gulosibacter chungangensis]|uniref:GntR family transcriptional regulator n=1 Tax=Gulosibacter chungangensis TaxID=979746 RepID=A0A7J5B8M5_9MICO|nr:GntR family transcriptional regulator [Gulosibacter chungangensis]KAB1641700.1 GntR family transcriptional regulator [Gulosibacter chungangensis]
MASQVEVARDIARRITDGEFKFGTPLPSELEFAAHYECSRGTIRAALISLEARGAVVPKQGSGWLVHSSLQNHDINDLRSFAQWAQKKGMLPSGRVVEARAQRATAVHARALRVAVGSQVLMVKRLRGLDDRVVMLERSVYPDWMLPIIEEIPDDEPSVVKVLEERYQLFAVHSEHSIDAVSASKEDAELLGVRRTSPLLRVKRSTFIRDGRALEFSEDRYVPGTIQFQVSSSRHQDAIQRTAP